MTSARVSVVMPTYRHAHFIRRAIDSLHAQTCRDWELIVVDDASPDDTERVVAECAGPIRYTRLAANAGLGAALNAGLALARGQFVAYLPSDDVYHAGHLATLLAVLERERAAVLAYSGLRHHYGRTCPGILEDDGLQLVQVMHRRVPLHWLERSELVTDDLARMGWCALEARGKFVGTGQVTCEWVDHPDQLHKVVREPVGGINTYRSAYGVRHPLRFHTRVGNPIDEVALYRRYRERPATPNTVDRLKILLVGELAYNADRILALEELGHRLYGLWMPRPYWYNTVGPLPFGHVEDLPAAGWREAIRRVKPDVVYALLNWQAVPFAHEVMQHCGGVPFVWHFKEGPFICLEKGTWRELIELYQRADGAVYSSPEMQAWFHTVLPGLAGRPALVLDGDLPKRDWFDAPRTPRLSDADGELHTVVPGRPIGLHPHTVAELAQAGVHLHFYGDFTHGQWRAWIDKARGLAPRHLHLHGHVDQDRWVSEFSRYDAGWLHYFAADNAGDLRRANWDDLNYPARLATLAAAGLPLLQRDNAGHIVASQTLARELGSGLFFEGVEALAAQLRDAATMAAVRSRAWASRSRFTFDHHAPRLVDFFRSVMRARPGHEQRQDATIATPRRIA